MGFCVPCLPLENSLECLSFINLIALYAVTETLQPECGQPVRRSAYQEQDVRCGAPEPEENSDEYNNHPVEENIEGDITKLTGRQKKLFELR